MVQSSALTCFALLTKQASVQGEMGIMHLAYVNMMRLIFLLQRKEMDAVIKVIISPMACMTFLQLPESKLSGTSFHN